MSTAHDPIQRWLTVVAEGPADAIAERSFDLLADGVDAAAAVRALIAWSGGFAGAVTHLTWLAAVQAGRLALDGPADRAAVPIATASIALHEAMRGRPWQHLSNDPDAIETNDVLARCARGPGRGGILAVAAAQLADVAPLLGPALARSLFARLLQQADAAPAAEPQGDWTLAAAAEDEAKGKAFVEPKFRAHLCDAAPDTFARAWRKAVEFGVPHGALAGALAMGAAERVLRFDGRHDADATVAEGWPDVAWLLVLAAATRRLRRHLTGAQWLPLATFTANRIHAHRTLDLAPNERRDLPEPAHLHATWDHGPEIARIVAHLQSRHGIDAMAAVRTYSLLALPEQPLGRQLVETALFDLHDTGPHQAIGLLTMAAAVDELHAAPHHPHRERLLCAAVRALAEPWSVVRPGALALATADRRMGGREPLRLVAP
jgi:hypothetical protein